MWLPEVKLWLGVEDGNCVCWDEAGEKVKSIVEEHEARVEAENEVAKERTARVEAEEKAAALEARLKELEEAFPAQKS